VALVHALTGGAVNRLPEERRRGITIDLGFSHFDDDGRRFALIDVPGHERFIHTMVAGASGVDAALLVVAADDSVMPQTREHLSLLQLLGVERGGRMAQRHIQVHHPVGDIGRCVTGDRDINLQSIRVGGSSVPFQRGRNAKRYSRRHKRRREKQSNCHERV